MDILQLLMEAPDALSFFMILAGHLSGELYRAYDDGHGYGMRLVVERNLRWLEAGRPTLGRKVVHEFYFYQDGTISWWMLGGPTLLGLEAIRGRLGELQGLLAERHLSAPA